MVTSDVFNSLHIYNILQTNSFINSPPREGLGEASIMSKIHLIIKKEYTERVMKKSFILLTFLTPVAFVAIMLLPSIIMQMQDQTEKHIVVIDRTGSVPRRSAEQRHLHLRLHRRARRTGARAGRGDKSFTALLYITDNLAENPRGRPSTRNGR